MSTTEQEQEGARKVSARDRTMQRVREVDLPRELSQLVHEFFIDRHELELTAAAIVANAAAQVLRGHAIAAGGFEGHVPDMRLAMAWAIVDVLREPLAPYLDEAHERFSRADVRHGYGQAAVEVLLGCTGYEEEDEDD